MPKIKIDKADRLCSIYVRLRDGKCLRCGSRVHLSEHGLPITHQASHFQGRAKENTRFNLDNLCTLDMGCHMYFTAHPAEHYKWQVDRLGHEKVDEIVLASNTYCKKDRTGWYLYFKQKLKDEFGIIL